MLPKKSRPTHGDESTLPFDVTQEIDPDVLDELLGKVEPTLTQADFDSATVVLPPKRKP